jgi:hypothetical protein
LWLIIRLGRRYGAWPQLAGWFERRAAGQVLQEPQPVGGHGQAAPAAGGLVEHGPDQGEAAGLPRKLVSRRRAQGGQAGSLLFLPRPGGL